MTRRLTQEGRKRAAREGLGCPRTFLIVVTGSLAVVIVYGPPISAYWHILLVVLAVATLLINVARCQKSKERMRVAVSEEVRADIGAELEALRVRELELGERGMPITVTQLAGKHHYFVVKPDDTVEVLKRLITKRTEIVGETQALRVAGAPTMLRDDLTLAGAGIVPRAELHLVVGASTEATLDE